MNGSNVIFSYKKRVKAKFLGENGSLYYKTNKEYSLTIFYIGVFAKMFKYGFNTDLLVENSYHPVCPYTYNGFYKNWKIIKVYK